MLHFATWAHCGLSLCWLRLISTLLASASEGDDARRPSGCAEDGSASEA